MRTALPKSENAKIDKAVRYALRLIADNYSFVESAYVASRDFKIDIHEINQALKARSKR